MNNLNVKKQSTMNLVITAQTLNTEFGYSIREIGDIMRLTDNRIYELLHNTDDLFIIKNN